MKRLFCILALVACICSPVCAREAGEAEYTKSNISAAVTGPLGNTVAVNPDGCYRGKQEPQSPTVTVAPAFVPEPKDEINVVEIVAAVLCGVAGAGVGVARQWKNIEGSKPVTL